jgi:hypothetical protein
MASYTSLCGLSVAVDPNEETYTFPKKMWEPLLLDHITPEWILDPVYLNNNIYDRESLSKWFRRSNIDPINGTQLTEVDFDPSTCNQILVAVFRRMWGRFNFPQHQIKPSLCFYYGFVNSV